jgi:hypothetical protein
VPEYLPHFRYANAENAVCTQVLPEYIPALYQRFHAKKWEKFNSEKVCNISYARIQGKASLIHHFSNSSLLHEDKRCRPIIFRSDGRTAGEQEPFPVTSHVSTLPSQLPCLSFALVLSLLLPLFAYC